VSPQDVRVDLAQHSARVMPENQLALDFAPMGRASIARGEPSEPLVDHANYPSPNGATESTTPLGLTKNGNDVTRGFAMPSPLAINVGPFGAENRDPNNPRIPRRF
jgi:hypothetical protein